MSLGGIRAVVTPIGSFGVAVMSYLASFHDVNSAPDDVLERSRVGILASWRPVTELCKEHDRRSHETGEPFIPIILEARTLTVGPVVVPGHGGCWHCWLERQIQHAAGGHARAAVSEMYDRDASVGPKGYLEAFALVAAAQASLFMGAIEDGEDIGGQLWQLDLLTRRITTSRLVGCDGCPRCGLGRPPATRTVLQLRQSLTHLWPA
jgi:bacteriocin biosynthesis cyclodehydratase domain-containing protein